MPRTPKSTASTTIGKATDAKEATGTKKAKTLVGENIARLRKAKGMTQTALAKAMSANLSHIARVETLAYDPSVDMLPKLMTVLDVSADELIVSEASLTPDQRKLRDLQKALAKLEPSQLDMIATHIDIYRLGRQMKTVFLPIPGKEIE